MTDGNKYKNKERTTTMFSKYNKFIVAAVGGIISGLLLFYGTDVPSWVNALVLVATALGVYQIPNKGV